MNIKTWLLNAIIIMFKNKIWLSPYGYKNIILKAWP